MMDRQYCDFQTNSPHTGSEHHSAVLFKTLVWPFCAIPWPRNAPRHCRSWHWNLLSFADFKRAGVLAKMLSKSEHDIPRLDNSNGGAVCWKRPGGRKAEGANDGRDNR